MQTQARKEKTEPVLQPARRLFSVAEYHRLGEAGVLVQDERVELIEGEIVEMTPIGSRHAACVDRLTVVRVQSPVRLGGHSEPQPDLCLLAPRADSCAENHPGPEDVLLVVEVADTSLEYDRETKLPLYSAAGIPEAWLVDVTQGRIEVYVDPREGSYRRATFLGCGDRLESAAAGGFSIPVDAILDRPAG